MIVSSGEQSQDIRYSFLNTLDHFACEYVRTLWSIQYLDNKESDIQLRGKARYLRQLVRERLEFLTQYKKDLVSQKEINKRYTHLLNRKKKGGSTGTNTATSGSPSPSKKLMLKINLKAHKEIERRKKRNEYLKRNKKDKEEENERYCFCNDVSYGPMIACDNEQCKLEWFHYGCVGITKPPTGKWYCSKDCRDTSK